MESNGLINSKATRVTCADGTKKTPYARILIRVRPATLVVGRAHVKVIPRGLPEIVLPVAGDLRDCFKRFPNINKVVTFEDLHHDVIRSLENASDLLWHSEIEVAIVDDRAGRRGATEPELAHDEEKVD